MQFFRIPKKRVSILKNIQKKIEESTDTRIKINTADVEISGEIENELTAFNIVKAVGRGFSPSKAFLLLDENFALITISLRGETEKTIRRLMARVIGNDGRSKKNIEKLTGAYLCIFGKTVSILGDSSSVEKAATAVEDLINGRKHSFVYSKLEKMNRM